MAPTITGRQRLLLNALSACVVLRLLQLGDLSLWADEGVTWWNAMHGSMKDAVFAEANHPPVWWVTTRLWLSAFPGREAALRMPAAICGAISVWLTYLLARRLCDPSRVPLRGGFLGSDPANAVWVTALAACSPFWIEYSQEARMYSALLAESLGLSLLYLRWVDSGRRIPLVGYAALAALALYTQYFAIWVIAAHFVHAVGLARRTREDSRPVRVLPLVAAQAAAGLLFVPWFLHMLGGYRGISPGVYEPFGRMAHALWRIGVGPGLVALDRPRVEGGPMAAFREEPWTVVGTALLWAVPIALGVKALWRDRGGRAFVLSCVAVPIVLVLAACVRWPLVHEKYLIFLAPFLLYLAVLGARSVTGIARAVLLGGLVVLHLAGLFAYYAGDTAAARRFLTGDHPYGKEQWREAHAFVVSEMEKGDVVLVHAPFLHMTWDFYDEKGKAPGQPIPPVDLPCDRELTPEQILERFPKIKDARQVFLVVSHEATEKADHYPHALLEALHESWGGVSGIKTESFPRQWGIRVLRYARGS